MKSVANKARAVIKKFGDPFTVTRNTSSYVGATGAVSNTTVTFTVWAKLAEVTLEQVSQMEGVLEQSDLVGLMYSETDLKVDDLLTYNSKTYRVAIAPKILSANVFDVVMRPNG